MTKDANQGLFSLQAGEAVECLGTTFPNDEARRTYFRGKLREKLKDPDFRKIEGFPVAEDEDILAVSDPPLYTACPNPFVQDYIAQITKERPGNGPYKRLPYPAALEDSRNNPFVNAHSYATKVPHEAVMRLILHYTDPGDVVVDGFVGTGMTAVAAQLCGDLGSVEGLGYAVDRKSLKIRGQDGKVISRLGGRLSGVNYYSRSTTIILPCRLNLLIAFCSPRTRRATARPPRRKIPPDSPQP